MINFIKSNKKIQTKIKRKFNYKKNYKVWKLAKANFFKN